MNPWDRRNSVDPDKLTSTLARVLFREPPTGFMVGRSAVRNAVMDLLGCSERESDEIIEALIADGKMVFIGASEELGCWMFRARNAR